MRTRTYKESYRELTALFPFADYWFWYGLLAIAVVSVPIVSPNYIITYITLIMISAVGAIGLNLVTGTAGLISLGHTGFIAIGAYTCGILMADYGWPVVPALLAAAAVSALSSLLVGVPSLRLRGLYLAITTLAFSVIVTHLIPELAWLTGGSAGKAVPRPDFYGAPLRSNAILYYTVLAACVLTILFAVNLLRSRVGRAWSALHDYDTAASLMGINLVRYKLLAFATSAAITGISGGLLAMHLRYLSDDNFTILLSIQALTLISVGGGGSVRGAVLGAITVALLPDICRYAFSFIGGSVGDFIALNETNMKGIVYALLIMFFLRYEPDGLAARWSRTKRYWREWPYGKKSG